MRQVAIYRLIALVSVRVKTRLKCVVHLLARWSGNLDKLLMIVTARKVRWPGRGDKSERWAGDEIGDRHFSRWRSFVSACVRCRFNRLSCGDDCRLQNDDWHASCLCLRARAATAQTTRERRATRLCLRRIEPQPAAPSAAFSCRSPPPPPPRHHRRRRRRCGASWTTTAAISVARPAARTAQFGCRPPEVPQATPPLPFRLLSCQSAATSRRH